MKQVTFKVIATGEDELTVETIQRALQYYYGTKVAFSIEKIEPKRACPECGKLFSHYTGCSLAVELI